MNTALVGLFNSVHGDDNILKLFLLQQPNTVNADVKYRSKSLRFVIIGYESFPAP